MTSEHLAVESQSDTSDRAIQSNLDIVEQALEAVNQRIYDVVDSEVEVLRDASRHILKAGGKRIRPRMVLLSFAATGGSDLTHAVSPAAALELVHTASVVHDDINDHGVVRRGRPSINSIWGRTFALLTGDYLFTKVYELMAPYEELNTILADATVALVEGETLQASAVKEKNLSSEVYFRIIGLKTAALFKAGAMMGARLSGATNGEIEALGTYGYNIGLAFQIVDDVLDIVGDTSQLGKTAGIDMEQGKGFASIQEQENGQKQASSQIDDVKAKFMSGDRINKALSQARDFMEAGVAALDAVPDSPYRDELRSLAYRVVDRTY